MIPPAGWHDGRCHEEGYEQEDEPINYDDWLEDFNESLDYFINKNE